MIVTVPRATWRVAVAVMAVAGSAMAGCGPAANPALVLDAQTAARVKTALVNDPIVGVRPIEVSATGGVVRLSGSVASPEELRRAVDVARAVDGVREVRSELAVRAVGSGAQPDVAQPRPGAPSEDPSEAAEAEGDPRLLAVGVSVRRSHPEGDGLRPATSLGPLFRVGSGRGLGIGIGFSWFDADLFPGTSGAGQVHIRPVMGGLAYTIGGDRVAASLSLVGGRAFNSVSGGDRAAGPVLALDVHDSFAWRSNVSLWVDVNRRTAFNVSAGHVVTRPRLSLLEHGVIQTRTLRADTTILSTGVAYKIF